MGSPCLFIRQRALKMGYFYWLRVKNSTHFHTELSLSYPEDTRLYLESRASFIDISRIASFKLRLVAWLRKYCNFSGSSVVSLKSWPWSKYIQQGNILQKKLCSTIKLFFFFKYVLYQTVLSKYLKKNWGSPCSLKRKGEFISLSTLVWGKSLTFCTCMRPCARADDAKIVRSRDAKCNTKKLP